MCGVYGGRPGACRFVRFKQRQRFRMFWFKRDGSSRVVGTPGLDGVDGGDEISFSLWSVGVRRRVTSA